MEKRGVFCLIVFMFFISFISFASARISVYNVYEDEFSSGSAYGVFDSSGTRGSLETTQVLLKVSLKGDGTTSRTIGLSSDRGGEVKIEVVNVPGIVLSANSLLLDIDEKKEIDLVFYSKGLEPGVYVGKIMVLSEEGELFIPVIFEVESLDVFFDVNLEIPPQYNNLKPGDKLLVQLKFFDLTSGGTNSGLGSTNVNTEYVLYNFEGEAISSETESIVVDKQASASKSVNLPEYMEEGQYVFAAIARYSNSVGVSTKLFSVSNPEEERTGFVGLDNLNLMFVLVLGIFVAFFLGVIFLFVYIVRDRDKMLMQLRRYNSFELNRQEKLLLAQGRVLKTRKQGDYREIKREISEKVRALKDKQKARFREFKNLSKAGNTKEMVRKLNKWRVEGYNTTGLEYRLKKISVNDMKKMMKEWKREGYGKGEKRSEGYKKK